MEGVLGEEFAASVFERADQGRRQYAGLAVDECLAPLMCPGIVKKQGHTFPVAVGTVSLDLLQLSTAIPDFPYRHRSIELDGIGRAGQGVEDASDVGLPHTEIEIEIMRAVPDGGFGRLCGLARGAGRKREGNPTDRAGEDADTDVLWQLHHEQLLWLIRHTFPPLRYPWGATAWRAKLSPEGNLVITATFR